ncbi:MAG: hypothetical protein A2X08_04850 [Bacteroidetes bacterium GWA2_32_17]|nr:MAG: hypothetical protein A2X08_04850 [Bacteroidetes bacterium GWA2_32_17]
MILVTLIMKKLDLPKFKRKLKIAQFQFITKTKKGIYFINPQDYNTFNYNDVGFIARHEESGQINIIQFYEVQEIVVDGKNFFFKSNDCPNNKKSHLEYTD